MDITLDQFSGPLDLLLQMIEDEKLDITEISLASVAEQYISYIEQSPGINPDEVADFLVIAARLLLIKSKTLLPYLLRDEEEKEIADFTRQLNIYKEFVAAAKHIEERYAGESRMHSRDTMLFSKDEQIFYPPPNVSGGVLQSTFAEVVERLRPQPVLAEATIVASVSMEERMADIRSALGSLTQLSFHSLFKSATSRIDVIVSFMALLELLKQKSIMAEQRSLFSDITILKIS